MEEKIQLKLKRLKVLLHRKAIPSSKPKKSMNRPQKSMNRPQLKNSPKQRSRMRPIRITALLFSSL